MQSSINQTGMSFANRAFVLVTTFKKPMGMDEHYEQRLSNTEMENGKGAIERGAELYVKNWIEKIADQLIRAISEARTKEDLIYLFGKVDFENNWMAMYKNLRSLDTDA